MTTPVSTWDPTTFSDKLTKTATDGYLVTAGNALDQVQYRSVWSSICKVYGLPMIELMQQPDGIRLVWYGDFQPIEDAAAVRTALERFARKRDVQIHFQSRAVGVVFYMTMEDAAAIASELVSLPRSTALPPSVTIIGPAA